MMLKILKYLLLTFAVVSSKKYDPAGNQLITFRDNHPCPVGVLTSSNGAPVHSSQTESSLNSNLLRNDYLIESMMQLNRMDRPERYVFPKGAGAMGYFETTHDISYICKAKLYSEVGKRTPVIVRFSESLVESNSIDTLVGQARGFAVRYYTEEGNLDILGINVPVFVIKDPLHFLSMTHSQKRNPTTHLHDLNTYWDYNTLHPEGLLLLMYKLSENGTPDGYHNMPGYSVHTYVFYNKLGEMFYVRLHYIPEKGIKFLTHEKATEIGVQDPDYNIRGLYNAIANGSQPTWNVSIQILTQDDVDAEREAGLDVCDITKTIPLDKYPLHPLGKLVLNKNPTNYFAEVESLAMNPANVVPGILGGCGKVFEARRMTYRVTQSYRLGSNFNNIPVNCPFQKPVFNYIRDGVAPINTNIGSMPDYYKNSFNGPEPTYEENRPELIQSHEDEPDNFEQTTNYYVNQLSAKERRTIDKYFIKNLCQVTHEIQQRGIEICTKIDPGFGSRIAKGLKNCKSFN